MRRSLGKNTLTKEQAFACQEISRNFLEPLLEEHVNLYSVRVERTNKLALRFIWRQPLFIVNLVLLFFKSVVYRY